MKHNFNECRENCINYSLEQPAKNIDASNLVYAQSKRMIDCIQVIFANGKIGEMFLGYYNEDGEPLLHYGIRDYVFNEFNEGCFGSIKIGRHTLPAVGTIERIVNVDCKLYWRTTVDHDIAVKVATLILKEYPDSELISFGAQNGFLFTQDLQSFKVVMPSGIDHFRGTLEEVRQFIDDNY